VNWTWTQHKISGLELKDLIGLIIWVRRVMVDLSSLIQMSLIWLKSTDQQTIFWTDNFLRDSNPTHEHKL